MDRSSFLMEEGPVGDQPVRKDTGKFLTRFQRLVNCSGGPNRASSDIRDSLPLEVPLQSPLEEQEEVIEFVCKALLTKMAQFAIICGYFFFVDNLPRAFQAATVSWTLFPLTIYSSTFLLVRLKKNPPHYGVVLIMILVTTVCFGYLVAIGFSRYRFHVISLPLSILFLNIAYFILIPLFFFQKVTIEMSKRRYYLIPLWIVWILNGILVVVTAAVPTEKGYYGISNKFDMICLFCLPTAFCSTLFTWFSMLQLRQIVEGQWFLVMFDTYYHDYLYAALYMI